MALAIRPYGDLDHASASRIWFAGWRSTGLAVAQAATEAGLYHRIPRELASGWSAYLAWQDDLPIGFLALKPAAGHLHQLFVLPEAQGTGVGRTLLDFAKEQLPNGIWLRTAVENIRACRFYERDGFRRGEAAMHPTLGHLTVIYRWP